MLGPDFSPANLLERRFGAFYASAPFATAENDRNAWLSVGDGATSMPLAGVGLRARMWNNAPSAFPASYQILYWDVRASAWEVSVDRNGQSVFTEQPDASGWVFIDVASRQQVRTTRVVIRPVTLGIDPTGRYLFEMADVVFYNYEAPPS